MKKIGFVIPWYGENIPGGAEMELRQVTDRLHRAGVELEILTTCIKDAGSDWSRNFHKEGTETASNGITVRRFRVGERNAAAFDAVNAKLMKGMRITPAEEDIFLTEMAECSALYSYMKEHSEEYSLFVFMPYLLCTTYNGTKMFPEKSVLIPCFHDEAYAYISRYREVFPKAAGMIFNARPEAELAERLYGFSQSGTKTIVMGIGMDTDIKPDAEAFRRKFGIDSPFIIYAGRKDKGKNVHTLVQYFAEYLKRRDTDLKLVLIGGGSIELPDELVKQKRIIDLGFVDIQDKYNGQAAAEYLCQPSKNESFSLVIMESWLCGRPVLVHSGCPVTRNFVSESDGGLYFGDYFEFEGCTDWFLANREKAALMGRNGGSYVRSSFAWDVIVEKYKKFFAEVIGEKE
ncbi:glycosyltransferase family 4 protein [uncultured Ruminococcus sp.]|uniref:glycosyltransferase family 4 protein n=1 Tax=uncultured Ruminococcus sp. TaxID=165186 RepID=UPI0026058123|nr:glycosyltransferase family 4 protein [uncultured Ruminococcus sp.]